MRWQWKCVLDSAKGIVPFSGGLRRLKYKFVRYKVNEGREAWTIKEGLQQIDWVRSVTSIKEASVLEIGTGWQPIIPILFSLAGARRVIMTDQKRLCIPASIQATLDSLRTHKQLIMERIGVNGQQFDNALCSGSDTSLETFCKHLRLEYLAPCDCRALDLPAESVDVVMSRAVLEHIPPEVIDEIFMESRRLLRSGGLACHFVDNSDHWQFEDRSISRVNFLKFSDRVFKWTCINSLNYQNRLRHSEYRALLIKYGFTILRDESAIDSDSLAALRNLPIALRFRHFTHKDLATIGSCLLACKPSREGIAEASTARRVERSEESL
jgi:SAM-dependent methyltransferase